MTKRERENPCAICLHYHKYEEGEVCGVCGHRLRTAEGESDPARRESTFPTAVLEDFLFIGTYVNASQHEILKSLRISHILNTVPACQNMYSNLFTYYSPPCDKTLDFDEAYEFLEKCKAEGSRVLVHCMTGRNRSPAFAIAYLMKSRGWRLAQCFQWVKDRRPGVLLTQASQQELLEYEQTILGPSDQPNESANFTFGAEKTVGESNNNGGQHNFD